MALKTRHVGKRQKLFFEQRKDMYERNDITWEKNRAF